MQEVVYLKNGSIIKGSIIEQIPNESLKIQTADGSIFFYKVAEIEKITKEVPPRKNTQSQRNFQYKEYDIAGYRGFVDLGYTIKTGNYGENRLELTSSHGHQFNPHFFLGMGSGFHYYTDADALILPLFIDMRGTILQGMVSPFFGVKTGYSFNTSDKFKGGIYLAPAFGVRFMVAEKTALNLSIGYTAQWLDYQTYYYGYRYDESKKNIEGFSLKLGVEF